MQTMNTIISDMPLDPNEDRRLKSYPNPVGRTATVAFGLASPGVVDLRLYDSSQGMKSRRVSISTSCLWMAIRKAGRRPLFSDKTKQRDRDSNVVAR